MGQAQGDDLFKSSQKFSGKVFTAHNFRLLFGSEGNDIPTVGEAEGASTMGAGALVQSVRMNYRQELSQIRELSSTLVYYVQGMPAGQANYNRIVTDGGGLEVIKAMSDPCNNNTMTLAYGQDLCEPGEGLDDAALQFGQAEEDINLSAQGVFVNQVTYQANVQNYQLIEDAAFQFATLKG